MRATPPNKSLGVWPLALAFIVVICASLHAQSMKSPDDVLLDVLVWGGAGNRASELRVDDYPVAIRPRLRTFVGRNARFRSRLAIPRPLSEVSKMGYPVLVGYERQLFRIATESGAGAAAPKYVEALNPCYEWEGYHDCPEREAEFAEQYLIRHPHSVFAEYLPLLIAHRWICTAEAYDYEKKPVDAARARAKIF